MADRPNFTFLPLNDLWVNMNQVTDIELKGEAMIIHFAGPMARRVDDPKGVATDTRRLVISDADDCIKVQRWLKRNSV